MSDPDIVEALRFAIINEEVLLSTSDGFLFIY